MNFPICFKGFITMGSIESAINKVLKSWNEEVARVGQTVQFFIDVKCRVKKFYVNKKDYYEQKIAELSLYQTGDKDLLLYRKELIMPKKVDKTPQHQIDAEFKEMLYEYFLYETIGTFCVTTQQAILNQDNAEYDIKNDRLKPHPDCNGMIVKATGKGMFYNEGDEFDVFYYNTDAYFVYTAHDCAKMNNGIGKIECKNCMIIDKGKPVLITKL